MTNLELDGKKFSTEEDEPSYEEVQKIKWKNYRKRWSVLDVDERCRIVQEMRHTSFTWIPKDFIYEVFDWLITELEYQRIAINYVCDRKRNQLKLVDSDET